jgi:hypothetical protein
VILVAPGTGRVPPYPDVVVSPDVPEADGVPVPGPEVRTDAPSQPRRSSRATAVAVLLLAVLLVMSVVVGALLVTQLQERNDEWQVSASDWKGLAHAAATSEASARAELEQRMADLAGVSKQLRAAKARIVELAAEKAQLADKDAGRQQQLDYQARVSQAAADVTAALDRCVDGQEQLITYLDDAARYDADDLARFRSDVSSVCGAATDASAALQRALDAG